MIFDKLFSRRTIPAESPQPRGFASLFGGMPQAGISVNEDTALTYSSVWACYKIITESISTLPCNVIQRNGDVRQKIDGHPVSMLMRRRPNPEMEPNVYKSLVVGHAMLWGAHYSEIERNQRGEIIALWPLQPDKMEIKRNSQNRIVYEYTLDDGSKRSIAATRIFRVMGLSLDGITPLSVISYARESLSLGMAVEKYGASFFGNGAVPGGIIHNKSGVKLGQEGVQNLLNTFNKRHKGPLNAKKVEYLDGGMEYQQIAISPEDSQFLESRKFSVLEVCRWFRMQPHKLVQLERAIHNNIESQNIEHVTDTLMPWIVRLEEAVNFQLIQEPDHFLKLNVNGLLRGDTATRKEYYKDMLDRGVFSIDDVLAMEDRNPLPNNMGKLRMVPLNMVSLENAHRNGGTVPQKANTEQLWRDPAERMARKEFKFLQRAAGKGATKAELEKFYTTHQQHIVEAFTPLFRCFGLDEQPLPLAAKAYCSQHETENWFVYGTDFSNERCGEALQDKIVEILLSKVKPNA